MNTQQYFKDLERDVKKIYDLSNEARAKGLDPKELSRSVGFADEEIGRLAKIFLEEVSTLKELREKISAIFAPKIVPDEYKEGFDVLRDLTMKAPHFDDYESYKNYLIQHSGLKGKTLFKPLRILIGGAEHGPELNDLYMHLKNYLKEVVK